MKPPEKITLYQLLKVCFFYSSCSLGSGEPNSNFLKDCLSIPWIWVCLFWTIKLERDLNDLLIMVPSTDNLNQLPCFLHIYLYQSCTIWQCSLWPLFRFVKILFGQDSDTNRAICLNDTSCCVINLENTVRLLQILVRFYFRLVHV